MLLKRSPLARAGLGLAAAALLVAPGPRAVAQQTPSLDAIAGSWVHHGFCLQVNADGSASAVWRTYRWCGPGVAEPCDQIVNNTIISGGHADLTFSDQDDSGTFHGQVDSTSDPRLLDLGPVDLTPQAYDMALLEQGSFQLVLCGEDAPNQAPGDVLTACGA
jgi:hypothetical protein